MRDELTDSDFEKYELEDELDACTCDFDEQDSCPVHYRIDDGSDEDDCMDCGMCDSCIERTKAFYEEMEHEHG